MSFNQLKFNQFVIDHDVIGIFDTPITLKSGRQSHWYINWRPITSDPFLLNQLSDFICQFVNTNNIPCDCMYGVPEGATKIGVISSFKWAQSQNWYKGSHCLPMGRSKEKLHGNPNDRYFVGEPEGQTIVIEDVTSTGGSLVETINKLNSASVNITAAIGLSNRLEKRSDGLSVKEKIEALDVPYYSLSNAKDLFDLYFEAHNSPLNIKEKIINEFNTHSICTF